MDTDKKLEGMPAQTGEGSYSPKICMWQIFQKEPEAVQVRHVARNRL